MVIAMFVGMFVLGSLQSAVGLSVSHTEHPDLGYLLMSGDMSVGMAVWMRFRGHSWRPVLEMFPLMLGAMLLRRTEYTHCTASEP
jgi:hypothetical protein